MAAGGLQACGEIGDGRMLEPMEIVELTSTYVAAHHFYEQHGFQSILKTELPLAFPIMTVDSKFYVYFLK